MAKEKLDVAVVSSKGQVVIPQSLREKLGIEPNSKLLVYGYKGAVIMKKLEVPDVEKELREIYREVDKRIEKYGELREEEIQQEIESYRRTKRRT
ncbi:MAG: AbrB/MazE/SpoVT family DNA-binding domain-containing protein [Candidatus Bathyarchaeia archaeon]